ncbi:MAG: branched-chain amino acid ABC transporter permease [Thermoproteota archaeon]|uniref:Branched-chain amino acid ABC transporter permease n=1 Tax=Ignisphaera aggregans TaxID=334771 RepID=A0A7J3I6E9_9CREN
MRILGKNMLTLLILSIVFILLPVLLQFNNYYLFLATTITFLAVIVSSWNLIGGFAGQLDLAAGAYIGLGAYTTGTLLIRFNVTPWLGMIAGGLAASTIAFLIGYPTFRFGLREVWYALSSAALVPILRTLFLLWEDVGGPAERYLPYYSWSFYHLRFSTYTVYFYILSAFFILILFINIFIKRLKIGYYLLAIRENEEAAEMLGIDTRRYKLYALILYSYIVGMIGGLYACITGYIHPSHFDFWLSIQVAVLGIVGGLGSVAGPPLITFVLGGVAEYLRSTLGAYIEGLHLIFYGIILMLIILFEPKGVSALIEKIAYRYGRRYRRF